MRFRTLPIALSVTALGLALTACGGIDTADASASTAASSVSTASAAADEPVAAGDQAPAAADVDLVAARNRGRNGRGTGTSNGSSPAVAAAPVTGLSADDAAGLVFMREEEKLARDVYLTLFEQWQLPTFENIAAAESRHTGAVQSLLVAYGIEDPVTDDAIGVFTDPDLDALYDELIALGSQSIEDALTVGAMIEDLDISDLRDHLAATDNPDIERVYSNLLRGSENHLRAFTGQLSDRGIEYEAAYLDQAEIDAILGSGGGRGRNG